MAWPCYRLVVVERLASWTEVTEKMSVEDVDNMIAVVEAVAKARGGGER